MAAPESPGLLFWKHQTEPRRKVGAGDGIRTRDIRLGRPTLHQLSYSRSRCARAPTIRPRPVAVRAHDIALGDLREDRLDPGSANHPSHACPLVGAIAMVKVHRARREPVTTVRARNSPKVVQDRCVIGPIAPLFLEPPRITAGASVGQAFLVLGSRTNSMAGGTDDVALRDLSKEAGTGRSERRRACEAERLGRRIAVVEVHLEGLEGSTTVDAWDATKGRGVGRGSPPVERARGRSPPLDFASSKRRSPVVGHEAGPFRDYRTSVQKNRYLRRDDTTPPVNPAASCEFQEGAAERRPEALLQDDEGVHAGPAAGLVVHHAHRVGPSGGPRLGCDDPTELG